MSETVVVLGASPKVDRYSYKAIKMLGDYGHKVIPVNPYHAQIDGLDCVKDVEAITVPVDTVTVYMRESHLLPLIDHLVKLAPSRVIFNPGAEAPAAYPALQEAGIAIEEACTLVLLRTDQF